MSEIPASVVLRIVRLSLLFGVLAFGTIAWFTLPQRQPSMDPDITAILRVVVLTLSVAAILASFVFRHLRRRTTDQASMTSTTIIAWAVGEVPAVTGAATYFLTGDAQPFFIGVAAFLLMLVAVPIPE